MLQTLSEFASSVFGGDVPHQPLEPLQVVARSILAYAVGLMLVRVGKSRFLSGMTPIDVILGFLLGSLLSRCITGTAGLSETFIAASALVAMHWLITRLAYSSHALGNVVKGHAYQLVHDGQIDWDAMRRAHISENDLIELMRLRAGVADVQQVKAAYKERNGEIGIIKHPSIQVVDVGVEDGVKSIRIEVAS